MIEEENPKPNSTDDDRPSIPSSDPTVKTGSENTNAPGLLRKGLTIYDLDSEKIIDLLNAKSDKQDSEKDETPQPDDRPSIPPSAVTVMYKKSDVPEILNPNPLLHQKAWIDDSKSLDKENQINYTEEA